MEMLFVLLKEKYRSVTMGDATFLGLLSLSRGELSDEAAAEAVS